MSDKIEQEREGGTATSNDVEAVQRLHEAYAVIRAELAKVIVGQEEVIDLLLIALFARGHVILEGVPGLAKTLMISSLAHCLGLKFHRIQFMPDLMPADITGTEVIQEDRRTGSRSFRFLPGPVFANVVLADEINRTPPKTQAALLEAMQERMVTVGSVRHELEAPFFRVGDAEPDRAGGDVSVAGGAAGSFHVQGVRKLSGLRGGVFDSGADDGGGFAGTGGRIAAG